MSQPITLCLDRFVLSKLLLDFELLLLGNQALSIHLLFRAATFRSDLEHMGSSASDDYDDHVRKGKGNLRLTEVELRKAAARAGSILMRRLRPSHNF